MQFQIGATGSFDQTSERIHENVLPLAVARGMKAPDIDDPPRHAHAPRDLAVHRHGRWHDGDARFMRSEAFRTLAKVTFRVLGVNDDVVIFLKVSP